MSRKADTSIARYGGSKSWKARSDAMRADPGGCACIDHCGQHRGVRCGAPQGKMIVRHASEPWRWVLVADAARLWQDPAWSGRPTRSRLTVAHLDHMPENNSAENLLACCARCHLVIDSKQHAHTRKVSRFRSRR